MRRPALGKARPGLSPRLRSGGPLGAQAGRSTALWQVWEQRWPAEGRRGRVGPPPGPQQAPSPAAGRRQVLAWCPSLLHISGSWRYGYELPYTLVAGDVVSEAAQQRAKQCSCWQGTRGSSGGNVACAYRGAVSLGVH